MPFNGSGTFVSLPPPDFPALPGTVILASSFNANMNDLFTNGLTKCLTRDGQSPPTANLPMAGFRFTGIGAGIADTDSAQLGQTMSVRGQVGTVDWDTKITNGIFEATAPSLTAPSVNFPPTSSFGQLQVISQGANIIQFYMTAHRAYSRMKLSGTWSLWAPQVDMSPPVIVASAATANIGDADSTDINISGTTGITSFGPGNLGVVKRLTFASTVTITYNAASLILANSVSYTTAAADVITFISLGGSSWKEIARWRRFSNAIDLDMVSTNGLVAKVSSGNMTTRTITGTANQITVTNGDGVAGDPTISLPASIDLTGKTITNAGTVNTINIDGGTIDGTVIGGAAAVAGSFTTLNVNTVLNLNAGQMVFPAVQNPSANVNTLDDYEEGTWTPTVSFNVPGTLSVTYGVQIGRYTKIGNFVQLSWALTTAVFSPGTASGNFLIQGIPFATIAASGQTGASGSIGGMTFGAGYTFASVTTAAAGSASLLTQQSGSDKTPVTMTASQWTGAVVGPFFAMTLAYMVA